MTWMDDLRDRGRRRLASLRQRELATLVLLTLVFGGMWAFAALANVVVEGKTAQLDRSILLAMRSPSDLSDPIGPGWMEEMGRDFTALGGVAVLTLLSLTVVGFLLIVGKPRAALFLSLTIVGGWLLSTVLKEAFDRPRPDLVPHGSLVYTASFPSGHSMLSAVTYLTIGALLIRVLGTLPEKVYVFSVCLVITFLVGISRVYLGVHWPTDVLAGWSVGAAWALLCWAAMDRLQRHGDVETPPGEEPGAVIEA